jgi:hypothetical protein
MSDDVSKKPVVAERIGTVVYNSAVVEFDV